MTTDDDLPPFPPESEWLGCEPPTIGDDFVGRTLARLRDCSLLGDDPRRGPDDRALARLDLPDAAHDADQVPEPSPSFVDAVMAEWRLSRDQSVREALPQYRVPEPSPEFVAKTLAALRERPRRSLRLVQGAIAAIAGLAAALVLWLAVRETPSSPEAALAQAVGIGAPADGPSLLGALLAAREFAGDELPIAPAADLPSATPEARR